MRVLTALIALLVIAVLVAAAVFFADHPGRVVIAWQGWRVETSVAVFAAAAILAALAAVFALRLLALILGSPRAFLRSRRERRRRAGYRALTQGMVAVAAGDQQEAQRHARRADALLADPPLTLLLSAQAAQLDGDETAAKKYFTAMLARPETEFLGLRGLLNHALRTGDRDTARRLAERARMLRPNAGWATLSLLDLEAREGRWEAARDTLAQAVKHRLVPAERARHHRGVILYELSRAALTSGDRRRSTALAAEAQGLTPDLVAPAVHHARLLLAERRTGPAAKAVEHAWRTAPQPELAQVYAEIHGDAATLARVKCFERLAAQNPDARESHLALAEAALVAQLWGEARRHLELGIGCAAVVSCRFVRWSDPAPMPAYGAPRRGRARRSRPGAGLARPRRRGDARPALCLCGLRRREPRLALAMPSLRQLRHPGLAHAGLGASGRHIADHAARSHGAPDRAAGRTWDKWLRPIRPRSANQPPGLAFDTG